MVMDDPETFGPMGRIGHSEPPRVSADVVSPAQLDLVMERIGRMMDQAVNSITTKVELMKVDLKAELAKIDQQTSFTDRTLASRIDAMELRLSADEKATKDSLLSINREIDEINSRGSKNFRLALSGVIFPTIVGVSVFVLDKIF